MSARLNTPRTATSPTVSKIRPPPPLARPAQIRVRGKPTAEDEVTILPLSEQFRAGLHAVLPARFADSTVVATARW